MMSVSINNGFNYLDLDNEKDIELMKLHWNALVSMMNDDLVI